VKKTIIALLFMFSIVLVGCDESATTDVGPNPEGENPSGTEYETEDIGEDPAAETEDNSTDGDS
jgi:hypothetical protein